MRKIEEKEFARICRGIRKDRAVIIKTNPIGAPEEILFWMLLSCLISYLSLTENDTPCFSGKPDQETYRQAILYVLSKRRADDFPVEKYLNEMIKK